MSNGESPGLGGYPDLAKPETRVAQSYRSFWSQLLVHGPTKARNAQRVLHATRSLLGRKQR